MLARVWARYINDFQFDLDFNNSKLKFPYIKCIFITSLQVFWKGTGTPIPVPLLQFLLIKFSILHLLSTAINSMPKINLHVFIKIKPFVGVHKVSENF